MGFGELLFYATRGQSAVALNQASVSFYAHKTHLNNDVLVESVAGVGIQKGASVHLWTSLGLSLIHI